MSLSLSVVLNIDPNSASARRKAMTTIKSVEKHYSGAADDLGFFIAVDRDQKKKGEKILASINKKAERNVVCGVITDDDTAEILQSPLALFLRQGAVVKEGDILKLIRSFTDSKLNIAAVKMNEESVVPASGTVSIHSGNKKMIEEADVFLMKVNEAMDLGAIIHGGLEGRSFVAEKLIEDEGFYYCDEVGVSFAKANKGFEIEEAGRFMEDLIEWSNKSHGYVSKYATDYILRVISSKLEEHGHIEGIEQYLGLLTDRDICSFSDLGVQQAVYLLSKKHGRDVRDELYVEDTGRLMFNTSSLGTINASAHIKISISNIKNHRLIMEGMTDIPHLIGANYRFAVCNDSGEETEVEISHLKIKDEIGFDGEMIAEGTQFKVEIPLEDKGDYSFFIEDKTGRRITLIPRMGPYSKLTNKVPVSYFQRNGYLVRYGNGVFHVVRYSKGLHRKYELEYLAELIKIKKPFHAMYRILYYIDKRFRKKPVWIVMDRPHLAKDNGEHMFKYLRESEASKDHDVYFVLKKDSRDYERMKKMGNLLTHNTVKHRLRFLEAQFLISAAANDLTVNAFGKSGGFYRDLYNFDFVYLRHGVSHNDQSDWLHRLKKNMRVLVATCKPEYNGILEGDYGYTEREVKLTGLARYDNLYDDRKKMIAILPTWRQNLEGEVELRSSRRLYIQGFTETEYFKFYNDLINNEKLLDVMREKGYKGVFYLHPVFEAQFKDFKGNDVFTVGKGVADYQAVFRESSLMVTDYSSVAFDFAYLKKPVIYSQFDEESFYKHHAWGHGYFTYREDGFGPITTDLDSTVDSLIEHIDSGCEMRPEYVEKVEKFFAYTDRNNRKRIYDAIIEAEEERKHEV